MSTLLTMKQTKFVKEYTKTGNGLKAAMKAYDTTDQNTACSIASENLRKPNIKLAIEDACNKSKLTVQHSINRLKKCIDSDKDDSVLRGLNIFFNIIGANVHKIETTSEINVNINEKSILKKFTDEEIIDIDAV